MAVVGAAGGCRVVRLGDQACVKGSIGFGINIEVDEVPWSEELGWGTGRNELDLGNPFGG